MTPTLFLLAIAAFAVALAWPRTALAHCDTLDGPAVADGRKALESGDVNHALKWIPPESEAELTDVFADCLAVRGLSPQAKVVADRLFLETLVRLHRAGEGAGFDGLKPVGSVVDPAVVAADRAIESGSIEPLRTLVPADRLDELARRLEVVLHHKAYPVDDVEAGREYIAAYVSFVEYAEGEDHGHEHGGHEHGHAHDHDETHTHEAHAHEHAHHHAH